MPLGVKSGGFNQENLVTFFINADKVEDTQVYHTNEWFILKDPENEGIYDIWVKGLSPIGKISLKGFKKIMFNIRSHDVSCIYITSDENISFDY